MSLIEYHLIYSFMHIPTQFNDLSASLTYESLLSDRPLLSLPRISNCAQ